MSEVQSRGSSSRGRGSARGGRASYGSRGTRGSRQATNGDRKPTSTLAVPEDEGEFGELKSKYANQLRVIKEMFPDWTQEDLVFALQETNGDLENTIERITEGTVSQWGEVKKKDRSRSKVKDSISTTDQSQHPTPREGRGRGRGGADGGRGGRGRGQERGRGQRSARGGSAAPTNGTRQAEALAPAPPAAEKEASGASEATTSWDTPNPSWDQSTAGGNADSWAASGSTDTISDGWVKTEAPAVPAASSVPAPEPAKSSIIPKETKKSWASMFAKPKPASAPVPVSQPVPPPAPEAPVVKPESPAVSGIELVVSPPIGTDVLDPNLIVTPRKADADPAINITPSKDALTETNVEQLPDTSHPAQTVTAASTIATSQDPRGTLFSVMSGQTTRPPLSGYAASAQKATGGAGRSSSFQRRVMDQQEAVVMPGNVDADRAAVQFGSLGINGSVDDVDVDEEREQAETRAQPPQHSPVAPRASLPPVAQPVSAAPPKAPEEALKPSPAPGLSAAVRPAQSVSPSQQSSQGPIGSQAMATQTSQSNQYNQFGRYPQQPSSQENPSAGQKSYDAFGQTPSQAASQAPQFDSYSAHQHPQNVSGISSASHEYSSYYTADNNQRGFNNYYPPYGHQGSQAQHEAGNNQQRAGSGFGQASTDISSQYATVQGHQSRYGHNMDAQGSGQNTPNTNGPGGQSQAAHMHQPQGQAGNYPYSHPYYNSPYYNQYMGQVRALSISSHLTTLTFSQYGFNQGAYGGHFGGGGKGNNMYSQHGYGVSPQTSYDHASSAAGFGGGSGGNASQQPPRDGSNSEYSRSGSGPQSNYQDPFNQRATAGPGAGYQGLQHHQHAHNPTHASHQNNSDGSQGQSQENLKPFGDGPKPPGANPTKGPSPRPGSAAAQSGTPSSTSVPPAHNNQHQQPPHHQQQQMGNFGGYPGHLASALHAGAGGYGGFGGLGGAGAQGQGSAQGGQAAYAGAGAQAGHQAGQGAGQGGYGQFGGAGYYGGGSGRGGWGGYGGQH
ncbi:MAG: hypothetical protein M1814_003423 [Vezdaea aestivalis]|nr:MAG: hypothetical protein M1814_003423 [Vezdaea aestivalis]